MGTLVTLYLFLFAFALVVYMGNQIISGKEELVSLRNFFFAGFIIFQVTGPALSIITKDVAYFHPANIESTSMVYSVMMTVFVVIFLLTYQLSTKFFDKRFTARSSKQAVYSPMGILVIAGVIVGFGAVSQYGLVHIPVLGPGFYKLAYGMYAIGAALAAWAAAPRLWNPAYLIPASAIIILAAGLTFSQNFGRRDILGVVLAILWALYFSHWRTLGFRKIFIRLGVVVAVGMLLLGLVTSARSSEFREQSAMENITSLKSASAGEGVMDMLYGQRAGLNSMWLIESRPHSREYDTLHTLKVFFTFPIPRTVWQNKPVALSLSMPGSEIKVSGKPKGWNIGPGIIGHIENDNPFIALWLYPILLGFFIRLCDRAVMWCSANPFVVLPMGAAIGQLVAMPRGELSTFTFIATINIIGSLVIMRIISWFLTLIGWIKTEQYSWDDEYDSQADDSAYEYDEQYPEYQ